MPLRRTQRSDGPKRPRWKDGSHVSVESTHANESQCDEVAPEPNLQSEPLVALPALLERTYEHEVSTRDRPARTGADARIEESAAMGEVGLALRPYGRGLQAGTCARSGYGSCFKALRGYRGRISFHALVVLFPADSLLRPEEMAEGSVACFDVELKTALPRVYSQLFR